VDRFRRARALVHAPTFIVAEGRALIGLGQFVEAQERFELVLREGVATDAPAVWKNALTDASKLLEEVKPKVAWLTVTIANGVNAQVNIDDQRIPQAAFDVHRATNPGTRTIEATAEGYEPQKRVVELAEGEQRPLTLTLKQFPAPISSSKPAPVSRIPGQPPSYPQDSNSKLPYVALGVGGLGIAVGAITGYLALRKHSELTSVCHGSACPPSAQSDIDTYHSLGYVSGISFGVGLAAATTGFVLLRLASPQRPKQLGQRLNLGLRLNQNLVGVEGTFQ
jgi:hypothetical protein